eukprot:TRINITY_DN9615_c0_g1_i4.p1 TRINITY_DN9615_c0_g1~~TRINITY_DN9615_c0_g1_i4.p1  ORF type:complete len:159 (-),score=41.48 TRINITY_DN9615_c0_g1_i4:17-493(-)
MCIWLWNVRIPTSLSSRSLLLARAVQLLLQLHASPVAVAPVAAAATAATALVAVTATAAVTTLSTAAFASVIAAAASASASGAPGASVVEASAAVVEASVVAEASAVAAVIAAAPVDVSDQRTPWYKKSCLWSLDWNGMEWIGMDCTSIQIQSGSLVQ